MIDAVEHVKERADCRLYKNGMCNKWRKEYKCRPTSIEEFDEVFSTCEIGETCERASIFGNCFYRLTDEDIDALKAGKVLFSVDEYGFFIAYQKKED